MAIQYEDEKATGESFCVYKYLKGDHKDLGMDKFELVVTAKPWKLNSQTQNIKAGFSSL